MPEYDHSDYDVLRMHFDDDFTLNHAMGEGYIEMCIDNGISPEDATWEEDCYKEEEE